MSSIHLNFAKNQVHHKLDKIWYTKNSEIKCLFDFFNIVLLEYCCIWILDYQNICKFSKLHSVMMNLVLAIISYYFNTNYFLQVLSTSIFCFIFQDILYYIYLAYDIFVFLFLGPQAALYSFMPFSTTSKDRICQDFFKHWNSLVILLSHVTSFS